MGSAAGTGIRSFAEGGSTSSGQTGGFGGINMAAIQTDSPTAPQRAVYRPEYTDYSTGLSSTPQAGYLASIIGKGLPSASYQNRMPTFTRPSAPVAQQASYNIPYRTTPDSSFSGVLKMVSPLFKFGQRTPEQRAADLSTSIQDDNLTEGQYDLMMADPGKYLSYVQAVQAGNAPETIGYQQKPVQYMTAAQQKAYNDKLSRELDSLLRPITVFQEDTGGGA